MMVIEKDIELDETIMFWKEMRLHTCKSKNKRMLHVSKSHKIVSLFFSNAPRVVINHKIITVNTNTYVAMVYYHKFAHYDMSCEYVACESIFPLTS